MSKLVVNTIEAQTYKYDSDTTGMTFNSDGNILRPNLIAFRATGNNANYVNTSPVPFALIIKSLSGKISLSFNASKYPSVLRFPTLT